MNKQQLTNEIARKTKLSKSKALQTLNITFDAIKSSLRKQQRVQLIGFGTFMVRERKARQGRNPRTGETIQIKARRVAAFSPSSKLKNL